MMREQATRRQLALKAQRFIFLRHGETDGNTNKIYQPADISLNPHGRSQAMAAAARLRTYPVQQIWASTMQRAWETASIVAQDCMLAPQRQPALRERWFGDFVGTSSARLDWKIDPPNGETLRDFVARTQDGIEAVLDVDDTLIVAHGGNLHVLAFSLGIRLTPAMLQNATPLLFTRSEQGWQVSDQLPNDGNLAGHTPAALRNTGW